MSSYYTPAMRRWMGGYEPKLAHQMASERSSSAIRQQSSEARMKQARGGTGWGTGTLEGIGENTRAGGLSNTPRAHMAQVHQGKRRKK